MVEHGDARWHLNSVEPQAFGNIERRRYGTVRNACEIAFKTFIICSSPDLLAASVLGNEGNEGIDKDGGRRVLEVEARNEDVGYALVEDEICKKKKGVYSSLPHFDTNYSIEDKTMSASVSGEESSSAFGDSDMKSFLSGEEGVCKFKAHRTSSTDAKFLSHSDALTGVQDSSCRVTNGDGQYANPSRRPRRRSFLRRIFLSCLGRDVKN
ncbi:hypothetical protein Aperf_G00000121071 [Anoplocephala perfoliata]